MKSLKTFDDGKLNDRFQCELCHGVVLYPVKCKSCEQFYCKYELSSWIKKSATCPHCRVQKPDIDELNRFEREFYNALMFAGCPNKGCMKLNAGVSLEEVKAHLRSK